MITKEQLQFLRKEFGELLTVINPKTKKPKAVFQGNYDVNKKPKYEWFYNWTDEELLKAESVGIYHQKKTDDFNKETVFGAVDPDDKGYIAHKYMKLIPNSLPEILTGVRVAIGMCWGTLVAAEFLAGTTGIGFVENVAKKYFQYEVIWITIFVIGMLGLLFDITLRKIIDKTILWRGKG